MGEIVSRFEIKDVEIIGDIEKLESSEQFFSDEEILQIFSNIDIEYIDIDPLSQQIFTSKNVILKEDWESIINLPSRFIEGDDYLITCESIIDVENRIFETKKYPIDLFQHLLPLEYCDPILIKLSSKPGSYRLDVYNGKGLVDLSLFNLKDGWEDLMNQGLDKRLDI